jgi:MoxR-like ATPase
VSERRALSRLIENVEGVLLGKRVAVETAVAALLARGHVLIEDVPGVGKTLLARALARSVDAVFRRIQCTPDLLPSDVTGVSIYDPRELSFEFRPGPVFTNVLLADELNRASPRTQSAFLEAMEEHSVSADGTSHRLPDPFFLIATQNPIELAGTFPLPEAQLDRFLVRLPIGYPDDHTEAEMLLAQREQHPLDTLGPVMSLGELQRAQQAVRQVFVHASVAGYIQRLVAASRRHVHVACGASPRGALGLMRAAQAEAALRGAGFVTPDHVKKLAPAVLAHRLILEPRSRIQGVGATAVVGELLDRVEVPIEYEP